MDLILKLFDRILTVLKMLGAASLAMMALVTCIDVVGRAVGKPIIGAVEIVAFLSVLATAFALPYTHQMKAHIGVEILVRFFSEKTQIVIDICTGVTALALMGLITWRMAVYAGTIRKSGEVSMTLKLPEYIFIYIVSFCFLTFFLVLFQDILRNIQKLRGVK